MRYLFSVMVLLLSTALVYSNADTNNVIVDSASVTEVAVEMSAMDSCMAVLKEKIAQGHVVCCTTKVHVEKGKCNMACVKDCPKCLELQ